jgi:hypothetical protein
MSSKRKEPPHVDVYDNEKVYNSQSEESGSSEDENRPKRRRTSETELRNNDGPNSDEVTQIRESSTLVLNDKSQVLDVTYIDGATVPLEHDQGIKLKDSTDQAPLSESFNIIGAQNSILLIFDSLHHVSPIPSNPSKKVRKNSNSGECTNCKTSKSPIWRKGPNNAKLCNKW